MSKRNLFSLIFLVNSFYVYGQSIPDTVKLEIDKNKRALIVKRKVFKDSQFKFQLKRHPDSTLVEAKNLDSLVKIINLYTSKKVLNSELIQKLQDTSLIQYPYIIELNKNTILPSQPTPNIEVGQQKSEFEDLWPWFITGLLLVIVVGLSVWFMIERKAKKNLKREKEQAFSEKLVDLLYKHKYSGIGNVNFNIDNPDQLVSQLVINQKALTKERDELHEQVYHFKKDLLKKEGEIKEQLITNSQLEDRLINLPEKLRNEFNSEQAVEKDRINLLCAKMIERKELFINSIRGMDENEAKKELLRFSVSYAETALAVLNEIRGKNSGSGKKNIQLLNGSIEPFEKAFDKHTPETAVDKEYILLAKLLSEYGIESIEDVYFNGDKYQQKNQ